MSSVHISIAVRAVDPDTDPDDNEPESAWLVQDNAIHLIDNNAIPNNDYPMHFDRVFDRNVSNEVVYNDIVAPLISDVTRGYNGSLMVCGPSFISKQFTMEDMFTDAGLIPRAIEQIFKIASKEKKRGNFIIRCSNIMLYKDKVYDLLRFSAKEANIVTIEHGKVTIGAKEAVVSTKNQAMTVFQLGLVNRDLYQENGTMDATDCDMIFRIIVEHTEKGKDNKLIVHSGCLNMVTLGGSDAGPNQPGTSTSNSDAQYEPIFATLFGKTLTMLLSNSIGGNAKAVFILNFVKSSVGATDYTLRFAQKAKNINNTPVINNLESTPTLLSQVLAQLQTLEKNLKELEADRALIIGFEEAREAVDLYKDRIKLLKKLFTKPIFLEDNEPYYSFSRLLSMSPRDFSFLELKALNVVLSNNTYRQQNVGAKEKLPFEMVLFNLAAEIGNEYISSLPEHTPETLSAIDYILSIDNMNLNDSISDDDGVEEVVNIPIDVQTADVHKEPQSMEPTAKREKLDDQPLNLSTGQKSETSKSSNKKEASTAIMNIEEISVDNKKPPEKDKVNVACTSCEALTEKIQILSQIYLELKNKYCKLQKSHATLRMQIGTNQESETDEYELD